MACECCQTFCCKCSWAVFFMLIECGIAAAGYWLYSRGFEPLNGYEFDGAPYLPDFQISYDEFLPYTFYSVCSCGVVFIFGFLAALCKNSNTATAYIFVAVGAAMLCL